VYGNGCVSHECRFAPRREEAHAQIVIVGIGPQHECGVAIVELTRDKLHVLGGKRIGVQHDASRVATEALRRKSIDLKRPHTMPHASIVAVSRHPHP
jgi:predicted RNase H-like nuclease (RuvC/YqgF family)